MTITEIKVPGDPIRKRIFWDEGSAECSGYRWFDFFVISDDRGSVVYNRGELRLSENQPIT